MTREALALMKVVLRRAAESATSVAKRRIDIRRALLTWALKPRSTILIPHHDHHFNTPYSMKAASCGVAYTGGTQNNLDFTN